MKGFFERRKRKEDKEEAARKQRYLYLSSLFLFLDRNHISLAAVRSRQRTLRTCHLGTFESDKLGIEGEKRSPKRGQKKREKTGSDCNLLVSED